MKRKYTEKEKWCNQLYKVLEDNLIVTAVVLHEYFGFGEKRIDDYMKAVQETAARFNEMAKDEVLDIKTDNYRRKYCEAYRAIIKTNSENFMPEEFHKAIFSGHTPTKREIEREVKLKNKELWKNSTSLAEAAELQAKMQAFGDFLRDKECNSRK